MTSDLTQIQTLLDELYNFTDKSRSSLTCTDQGYDPLRRQHLITLEYRVTVPRSAVADRQRDEPEDDSLLSAILADVRDDRSGGER